MSMINIVGALQTVFYMGDGFTDLDLLVTEKGDIFDWNATT